MLGWATGATPAGAAAGSAPGWNAVSLGAGPACGAFPEPNESTACRRASTRTVPWSAAVLGASAVRPSRCVWNERT